MQLDGNLQRCRPGVNIRHVPFGTFRAPPTL